MTEKTSQRRKRKKKALTPKQKQIKVRKAIGRRLRQMPDEPEPNKPRIMGRNSRLGFFEFCRYLFLENAYAARPDKRTDAALKCLLADEFPHTDESSPHYTGAWKHLKSINSLRAHHNRGWFNRIKPAKYCFRYNESGDVVDSKAKRLLKREEILAVMKHYDEYHERKDNEEYAEEQKIRNEIRELY